jgi:hypothetical protein
MTRLKIQFVVATIMIYDILGRHGSAGAFMWLYMYTRAVVVVGVGVIVMYDHA